MFQNNYTRGWGIFESLLAELRFVVANKFIPKKKRAGRILDIGCGSTPQFLKKTQFREKYGLDKLAVRKYGNINFVRQDIEKDSQLPFKNDYFDVVTMIAVFEHLQPNRIASILIEIRRILKPNGRFILTTPCPWSNHFLKLISKVKFVSSEEVDEHKKVHNHRSLIRYVEKGGFDRNKINLGYYLYLNNWLYVDK